MRDEASRPPIYPVRAELPKLSNTFFSLNSLEILLELADVCNMSVQLLKQPRGRYQHNTQHLECCLTDLCFSTPVCKEIMDTMHGAIHIKQLHSQAFLACGHILNAIKCCI